MEFVEKDPTLENYWRAIILFGANTASYKFALAHALYDLADVNNDLITLDDLALPFASHICRHLAAAPKQATSPTSKFLDSCRQFNAGEKDQSALVSDTLKYGFVNVIDAFHKVNRKDIDKRFFIDERKANKGVRITDSFFKLSESPQYKNFESETGARWRLVEEAWASGVGKNLIAIEYDQELKQLFTNRNNLRVDVTSVRSALNGYQKGKCFYCYKAITIVSGDNDLADVDHFIPFVAQTAVGTINGVWNLVLSCSDCNRGVGGKFAHLPTMKLLKRLHKRNEYFISSHLPLRETLIRQTGQSEALRKMYLQNQYDKAKSILIHTWEPEAQAGDLF